MQQENLYTPDCIRTYTGKYVNVFEPTLDMICIEDIAHSLSMQCRFGGHLPVFYSVAQHSLEVRSLVTKEHKLAALLHDASEAYLLDIPRPIKVHLKEYKIIEDRLMKLISEKFGFEYPLHDSVKHADEQCLQEEWNDVFLKDSYNYRIMPAKEAEYLFINVFKRLCYDRITSIPK